MLAPLARGTLASVTVALLCLSALGKAALGAPLREPRLLGSRTHGPCCRVHVISPVLRTWFRSRGFRAARGRRLMGGSRAAAALDGLAVTIRLDHADSLTDLMALEGSDIMLRRAAGRILAMGRVAAAVVTEKGLDLLEDLESVQRVELDMAPPVSLPLDLTAVEINAIQAWVTRTAAQIPLTGHGILVADLDSTIDPLHPHFFRADGGVFDWIDVNDNDRFDPATDAVDLNSNGLADQDETLRFIDGLAYSFYTSADPVLDSDDGLFDVGWDHLYADSNRNGKRDIGTEDGFSEEDATYGEPLFLVDDVNGNGVLDRGEKLVALGTSKIRAVYDGHHIYTRGDNLIEIPVNEEALHGTGVAGILMGGTPGLTTLTGIAPDAELVMGAFATNAYASLTDLLIWAVQQGANVVLHEYAPWTGVFLDGSTNHEEIMDQAAADGVPQVNPSGNLGGSMKHCRPSLQAQSFVDVPVEVPAGGGYTFMELTFHWRMPERDLGFVLTTPSNVIIDLGTTGDSTILADGTTHVEASRDDSSRGTAMMDIWVYGYEGMDMVPFPAGSWTLTMTDDPTVDPTAPAVELSGYAQDEISGWGVGVRFPQYTSEEHLMGWPSTADSAISVAAYTGHGSAPYQMPGSESSGQLRRYSCRGKRMDGVSIMDIGAPDNPLTPINRMDYYDIPHGAYMVFGGTSGAGPHVAGAAALIKQLYPEYDGLAVRQAIRQGALKDSDVAGDATHEATDLWGAGKLRVYEALYGESPAPNTPPSITIAPVTGLPGEEVTINPTVQDAEDAVQDLALYWDDDYDGAWDQGPVAAGQARQLVFQTEGTHAVKIMVVDTGGLSAAALAMVTISSANQDGGMSDGGVSDGGGPSARGRGGCSSCSASGRGAHSTSALHLLLLLFSCFLAFRRRLTW